MKTNALTRFFPVPAFRVGRGRTDTTTQPSRKISHENRHLQVSGIAAWLGGVIPRPAFLQSTMSGAAGISSRRGVFLSVWETEFENELLVWRNDTRLLHLWNGDRRPVNRRKIKKELDELLEKAIAFLIFREGHQRPCGFVYAVKAPSPVQQHYSVGCFVGDANQGQGVGPAAAALFIRYLFTNFNTPKLEFTVYAWNEPSLKAVSHLPQFQLEGVRKNHVHFDGKLHDLFEFGLSREGYEELRQTAIWKRIVG